MDDKSQKSTPENPKIIQEQLSEIKNGLTSVNEHAKSAAENMLDALLVLSKTEVDREVVRMISDPSTGSEVQKSLTKAYKKRLTSVVSKGQEFIRCVSEWKDCNTQKLMDMLESIFVKNMSKETCKSLFLKDILPAMFSTNTSNDVRNVLIEVSFLLAAIIPISTLTSAELEDFLEDMSKKYVANIEKLRDHNYQNWDKLLIFLIKYCSVNLHNSIQLTNKVLRVVEFAFKHSSVELRIKGYACWKEIIKSASQNLPYFHGRKQIKLLVTPLKANFSKQDVVICKRFELFVYLMEKLQEKAVLCLSEFLQFQFGALNDHDHTQKKMGQGRTVPKLLVPGVKVLIALMGHSHGKDVDCLSTEDTIRFKSPIVTHLNFQTFYNPIMHSIGDCCVLLKDANEDIDREKVVKCLWKSLFDLVLPAVGDNKTSYFNMISHIFNVFLNHLHSDTYFQNLLKWVLSTFMLYEKQLVHELFKYLLGPIVTTLSSTSNLTSEESVAIKEVFSYTISKITPYEEKLTVIQEVISIIVGPGRAAPNASNIKYIWTGLAEELVVNFNGECIEKLKKYDEFFMWPLYNMHHLDEVKRKHVLLEWFKLYRKMSTDDSKKSAVLNNLRVAFKNNPLLVSNVISLLEVMMQYNITSSKDYVLKLMKIIISISELPTLRGEDEQKVTNMFGKNLDSNMDLLKNEGGDEIIESTYQCVERLLTVRKNFKILETFAAFLKKSPEGIRKKFSTLMSNFLQELLNKELLADSYNAKELQKVISLLDTKSEEKKTFVLPSGRSAKIARLVKKLPKSPDKSSIRSSESPLRLFGTDPETMSPIRVKGSQLNNTPHKKPIKPNSNVPKKEVIEENSQDFVPIDTMVKFQPHKMPEHQQEAMRKKREDIPALYQDLSQSNSQDLFGSRSNSNSYNDIRLPKVIVERIDNGYIGYINPNLKVDEDLTQVDEDLLKKIEHNETNKSSKSGCLDKSDCSNSTNLESSSEKTSKKKSSPKSTGAKEEKVVLTDTLTTPQASNDNKEAQLYTGSGARRKLASELSKLKMDIVGAETYTSAPRRTRPKNSEIRFSSSSESTNNKDTLNQNETPKTHRNDNRHLGKKNKSHKNGTEQSSEKEEQEYKKKRKRNIDNDDDIIESSQKPYDVTPLSSPRKQQTDTNSSTLVQQKTVTDKDFAEDSDVSSKKIISETQTQDCVAETQTQNNLSETPEPALNTTQDTTVTQESDTSVSTEASNRDNALRTQSQDTITQPTQDSALQTHSQDTITQPTQDSTIESQVTKTPTLYFDLPKKPVTLTDSEQFQCKMDTMSICLDANSLENFIVKQGNAVVTDNNNALDPYQSIPSSPVTSETPSKTSTLLSDTINISPINSDDSNDTSQRETCSSSNLLNRLDLKSSDDEHSERSRNEGNQEITTSPPKSISGTMNIRSSKLLNMIHTSSPTMRRVKRRSGNSSLSPSSGNVLKYICNNLRANSPSREEEDFLTFSREIPSPLAVPRTGILKRKLSEVGDVDGMSPCAKRKRVNFSDPCLTSKKLFIKDDVDGDVENGETENGDMETESSEEVVYPSLLKKNQPFYPNLIDCNDDISHITQKMTTPAYHKTLAAQFQLDGIKTVGDLAHLSETEMKEYVFKPPPLKTVHNVLERYWKRKRLNKANKSINSDDKKREIEEEFKQLMQKAAVMDLSSEHLAKIFLSSLDEHQAFTIFRTFNFPLKCLLEGQDLQNVVRWVLGELGTCKTVELLNDYCDSATLKKNLLNKFSLTEILVEKNVTELKVSISELVKDDPVKRGEVIENCLVPLIRTPKDISGYLSRLAVVDLEDIVLERIHFDDLDRFLQKLSEKVEHHSLAVKVLRKPSDITKAFKCCLDSQAEENQEEIMTEMFRFIGERLSLENLVSLHAEFLQRIPKFYVKRNE